MTDYDIILPDHRIAAMTAAGLWSERTIVDYFAAAVAAVPDKPAISAHEVASGACTRLSYAELGQTVERVALGLAGARGSAV